jgi:hypothetical protein
MDEQDKKNLYSVKVCYNCATPLASDATECYSCQHKVGKVDRQGKARRPTDWLAYIVCIISWAFFFAYVWWAFF